MQVWTLHFDSSGLDVKERRMLRGLVGLIGSAHDDPLFLFVYELNYDGWVV